MRPAAFIALGALLAVALAAGCANVFDRLERKLVFHPKRVHDDDASLPGVESAYFSVADPAEARRRRQSEELQTLLEDLAVDLAETAIQNAVEGAVEGAIESSVETAFDDILDEPDLRDKRKGKTPRPGQIASPWDDRRQTLSWSSHKKTDDDHWFHVELRDEEARANDKPPHRDPTRAGDDAYVRPFYWRLHGAFVEAPRPDERTAVVLYCHGSRGCIDDHLGRLQRLAQRNNAAVFGFDYRGYGRSEGRPHEQGILADARAARLWLANRTGVREDSIILIGGGLGAAVAVDLAAADGCRGLVLESAFTSLRAVTDEQAPDWLPPSRMMAAEFDSLAKIKNYSGPLLQMHGDANHTVSMADAKKLHQAAPGTKTFVTIKGGKHECPPNEKYRVALEEFLAELPPESGDPHARRANEDAPAARSESLFGAWRGIGRR